MPAAEPLALPNQFAFIGEGGLYRARVEIERLGEQNDLIKSAANAIPVDMFNVALSPLKQFIHLRVSGPTITSYTQLTHLNLDTWWTLFDKGSKIYPCWANLSSGSCSQRALRWNPPKDMGLFYVSQYASNNWSSSFLVAIRIGVEKYYRLPTGNVNAAGQICMGRMFRSDPLRPLIDRIQGEVELFMKTTWNTDLLHSTEVQHIPMFSYLADGSAQVTVEAWEKHCMVMNATVYNGLPFQKVVRAP